MRIGLGEIGWGLNEFERESFGGVSRLRLGMGEWHN